MTLYRRFWMRRGLDGATRCITHTHGGEESWNGGCRNSQPSISSLLQARDAAKLFSCSCSSFFFSRLNIFIRQVHCNTHTSRQPPTRFNVTAQCFWCVFYFILFCWFSGAGRGGRLWTDASAPKSISPNKKRRSPELDEKSVTDGAQERNHDTAFQFWMSD